jgi:hypothetical protein
MAILTTGAPVSQALDINSYSPRRFSVVCLGSLITQAQHSLR